MIQLLVALGLTLFIAFLISQHIGLALLLLTAYFVGLIRRTTP